MEDAVEVSPAPMRLANLAHIPDNHPVMCASMRRFAACLAMVSLLGWLGLPSEHIHIAFAHGHTVEQVHRHFAAHVPHRPDDHDHAEVGHGDDAVYLQGQVADVASPDMSASPGLLVSVPVIVAASPARDWLPWRLPLHVHSPPWGRQHARRGPPTFAV